MPMVNIVPDWGNEGGLCVNALVAAVNAKDMWAGGGVRQGGASRSERQPSEIMGSGVHLAMQWKLTKLFIWPCNGH
jgi:hypothetical protein